MVELLAISRNTTPELIEDTMTLDQIQLRYSFYLRERHRDADRVAMAVCLRAFGKADQ